MNDIEMGPPNCGWLEHSAHSGAVQHSCFPELSDTYGPSGGANGWNYPDHWYYGYGYLPVSRRVRVELGEDARAGRAHNERGYSLVLTDSDGSSSGWR